MVDTFKANDPMVDGLDCVGERLHRFRLLG
jgi:hypothetical protein